MSLDDFEKDTKPYDDDDKSTQPLYSYEDSLTSAYSIAFPDLFPSNKDYITHLKFLDAVSAGAHQDHGGANILLALLAALSSDNTQLRSGRNSPKNLMRSIYLDLFVHFAHSRSSLAHGLATTDLLNRHDPLNADPQSQGALLQALIDSPAYNGEINPLIQDIISLANKPVFIVSSDELLNSQGIDSTLHEFRRFLYAIRRILVTRLSYSFDEVTDLAGDES